jgi:outer membrane receptor protein involved in Fe transport
MELGLRGTGDKLAWTASYSYLLATFESRFRDFSPHHPDAVDFGSDGNPDGLVVQPGARIPGLPQHSLKLGADYSVTSALHLGADLVFNSSQYLRGDEANRLRPLGAYALVGLHGEYRLNRYLTAFARIDNLFDTDYETFGVLGAPDTAPGLHRLHDPRFVSPGAPRAGWVGIRATF